jgi:hypothetical protein
VAWPRRTQVNPGQRQRLDDVRRQVPLAQTLEEARGAVDLSVISLDAAKQSQETVEDCQGMGRAARDKKIHRDNFADAVGGL